MTDTRGIETFLVGKNKIERVLPVRTNDLYFEGVEEGTVRAVVFILENGQEIEHELTMTANGMDITIQYDGIEILDMMGNRVRFEQADGYLVMDDGRKIYSS